MKTKTKQKEKESNKKWNRLKKIWLNQWGRRMTRVRERIEYDSKKMVMKLKAFVKRRTKIWKTWNERRVRMIRKRTVEEEKEEEEEISYDFEIRQKALHLFILSILLFFLIIWTLQNQFGWSLPLRLDWYHNENHSRFSSFIVLHLERRHFISSSLSFSYFYNSHKHILLQQWL